MPACSLICGNTTPKMRQTIDIELGFCFSSFNAFFLGTDKRQQQSFSRCFVLNRDENKWLRLDKKVVRMKINQEVHVIYVRIRPRINKHSSIVHSNTTLIFPWRNLYPVSSDF